MSPESFPYRIGGLPIYSFPDRNGKSDAVSGLTVAGARSRVETYMKSLCLNVSKIVDLFHVRTAH
jgi:hypothetical protein